MVQHAARRDEPLVRQVGPVGERDDDAHDLAMAERHDEHRADADAVRAQVVERPAQRASRRDRLDLCDRRHRSRMAHGPAGAPGGLLAWGHPAHAYHRPFMSEPPPASSRFQATAAQVAGIVEAAERTAEELRAVAEARAQERIAEAERAAALRVQAADDEAAAVRAEAEADAERTRSEALALAQAERERGQDRAREIVFEARAVTREVLREGELLSGHLHELADSLRVNAERLLRDVRDAAAQLTALLDRVDPGPADRDRVGTPAPELDVPEFKPRRR